MYIEQRVDNLEERMDGLHERLTHEMERVRSALLQIMPDVTPAKPGGREGIDRMRQELEATIRADGVEDYLAMRGYKRIGDYKSAAAALFARNIIEPTQAEVMGTLYGMDESFDWLRLLGVAWTNGVVAHYCAAVTIELGRLFSGYTSGAVPVSEPTPVKPEVRFEDHQGNDGTWSVYDVVRRVSCFEWNGKGAREKVQAVAAALNKLEK